MKYDEWFAAIRDLSQRPPGGADADFLVKTTLAARGVIGGEEQSAFLDCPPESLHDPFLFSDMGKAVARIKAAIAAGERIAVYGDYDADGLTACALMYLQLTDMGADCITYIPNRLEDGYGLRAEALDALRKQGASLCVTVDTGVTALAEAGEAAAMGLDLIITDHHECRESLPRACAVIDPKAPGCTYPFDGLAGVGVAFKLACALSGQTQEAMLSRFGDLVALGTVADIMPCLDENKRLIRRGLETMRLGGRPGICALITDIGIKSIRAHDVGFRIAPRLNAAGRMGRAELALELLLCDGGERAKVLAARLGELNTERRAAEDLIFTQALAALEKTESLPVAVLAGEDWHPGVTGIVAGRLAEKLRVPVFMISLEGDTGKGSARSTRGESLVRALSESAGLLKDYGGHELAAGFTVPRENIPPLRDALTAFFEKNAADAGRRVFSADAVIHPSRAVTDAVRRLDKLEPFGAENPKPVFIFENVHLREVSPIGSGKHTRFTLDCAGMLFHAVWFGVEAETLDIGSGEKADILFTPEINKYYSREVVQLHLVDIRPSAVQLERDTQEWDSYSRFCRGGCVDTGEARLLRPSRRELGTVWRRIRERKNAEGTALALARELAGSYDHRVPLGMVWVALDVFAEYNLIMIEKGDIWRVCARPEPEEKTDASESGILKRLDALM
ncbi:MAG: single-stranded-DNA-specific exonuclease RecJ [Oscillospiraceae bacterium]|nr:single-stranded-DNA-specific exonuclease RecJ [Oscillospiraceae bacterium]